MEMELLENGAIRCVVGQSDLDRHNITMLDFVIHPESSRSMLQEFIELAYRRYGFLPASNTLIEAVPLAKDQLILTFSNGQPPFFQENLRDSDAPEAFAEDGEEPSDEMRSDESGSASDLPEDSPLPFGPFPAKGNSPMRNRRRGSRDNSEFRSTRLLMRCNDILDTDVSPESTPAPEEVTEEVVICFRKLENLMAFADITKTLRLSSTLFYGAIDRCYVLRLDPGNSDPADLRYAGSLADEYGTRIFEYSLAYYREYFRCIAEDDALEKLRSVR